MANHKPQPFYSLRANLKYHVALPLAMIVVFLGVWELVGFFGIVPVKYLPVPSTLVVAFSDKPANPRPERVTLIQSLVSSIQISFMGFLIAIIIGIPLGLLMGSYELFDRLMKPVSKMIRPIPPIARIPLTIAMLGTGFKVKTLIIYFAAFVPCIMNAYASIKLTNPTLIQVAGACEASNLQIFSKVCIPLSVQMVLVGVQIALSASWSILVMAETLASSSGLRYMMQMGRLLVRPDLIVLGMLIIDIIGFLFSALLTVLKQNLTKWRVVR